MSDHPTIEKQAQRLTIKVKQATARLASMVSAYPTTLEEARAYLAMRPIDRWKLTETPEGTMERCADLLAAEVERLTAQANAIVALLDERAPEPLDDRAPDLVERIRREWADFMMVINHCTRAYYHMTDGRISKVNTLPEVVTQVADELESSRTDEAIKEAREEWDAERASSVSASEARRREREAFVQGVGWRSVVGVCAGSQVGDELTRRYPEEGLAHD